MHDREKNLFDSYAGRRISRRDLLDGAAKLYEREVASIRETERAPTAADYLERRSKHGLRLAHAERDAFEAWL